MFDRPLSIVQKTFGAKLQRAKVYEDYRKLLDSEQSVDAVIVASGQRWHVLPRTNDHMARHRRRRAAGPPRTA